MIDVEYLVRALKGYDIEISSEQGSKLDRYVTFLIDENKKYNLTAINDPKEIADKHIIDSLLLLKAKKLEKGSWLLNIGAGGGFPSLPIAILRDDLRVFQLEASKKKVDFLDRACKLLNLNNVANLNERAEILGREVRYREKFDYVTARAVAKLNVLAELAMPYLKVGGSFLPLKAKLGNEVNLAEKKIFKLGGGKVLHKTFILPMGEERNIIIIKKISQTPIQYPRIYSKIIKDNN